jgi:2-hydroxy-3-keto-5-methylthiopentenyl-1-phosphate phosphatase
MKYRRKQLFNMVLKGFLLDFDGTITSNIGDIVISFTTDFIQKITPIKRQTIANIFMTLNKFPPDNLFSTIFTYLGIEDFLNQYLLELQKITEYNNIRLNIRAGFNEFISTCHENKIRCLVFSTQTQERIKFILGDVSNIEYIDIKGVSKSNLYQIKKILLNNNILPEQWILVEDDPFIIRTGKLLGLKTILMKHNLFIDTEINEYKEYYDYLFESFFDVLTLIKN